MPTVPHDHIAAARAAIDAATAACTAARELLETSGAAEDGRPLYYSTAEPGPLGSARAFADAARRGDFATFKVRRRLTAKAADVHAALEARTRVRRPKVATPLSAANDGAEDEREELAAMGVTLTAPSRRAAGAR